MCSYPGCCVLQYPPVTYKCKDSAAICAAFVDCLHSRLPTLCSYPINYSTRLLQPDVGLSAALHSRTFVNLLHVGRKPASVGTTCRGADCSSTTVFNSDSAVKSNRPCMPIFHSLLNEKNSGERRQPASHSLARQCGNDFPHKLLPTPCATNISETVEQGSDSNNGQIRSTAITSALSKITATNSCLHKVRACSILLSVNCDYCTG